MSSLWVGKTPLFIKKPQTLEELVIKMDSYKPLVTSISPANSDSLFFALSPKIFDRSEYIKEKKNAFYTSLGAFALSVPLPVILYSIAGDIAASYRYSYGAISSGTIPSSYRTAQTAYHMYIGSVFLSAALLGNSIIRLVEYVIASTP
jgi:hypothetical protein